MNLKSKLKRWIFCNSGQHELTIDQAVVQGASLRYSLLTAANIIADVKCLHCPHKRQVMYRTYVILQKPKDL